MWSNFLVQVYKVKKKGLKQVQFCLTQLPCSHTHTHTQRHHFSLSLSCFHHFIGLYLLLFNIDSLQPYFPFPSKVVSVFSSTFPSTLFFSSFIAINISAVSHKVWLKSWKLQSKKKYTTHQWTNFMA